METRAGRFLRHATSPDNKTRTIELDAVTMAAFLPPVGSLVAYGGSAAPDGWLLCDGTAVSRSDYAGLFSVIGTTFGTGDGSTTFNLPDLRARVPGGYKSGDANFGTLGGTGGEATHVLTTAEMPSHTHVVNQSLIAGSGTLRNVPAASGGGPNSGATGGDGAHNNIQPFQTVNYIVKA